MTEWQLYLGTKFTGVIVRPDDKWPSMFRIHWPDQPPSDIVNLTRAKDAAMRWAARRTGANTTLHLKWKLRQSPAHRIAQLQADERVARRTVLHVLDQPQCGRPAARRRGLCAEPLGRGGNAGRAEADEVKVLANSLPIASGVVLVDRNRIAVEVKRMLPKQPGTR